MLLPGEASTPDRLGADRVRPSSRARAPRAALFVASIVALAGCEPQRLSESSQLERSRDREGRTAQQSQPVVYGLDDRRDVYAYPEARVRSLAQRSIAALVRATNLETRDPANVTVTAQDLQRAKGLCDDQRFLRDPTAAFCSGTLIDDDLLLTAGHCIDDEADCRRTIVLFGYYRDGADSLNRMTQSDVFRCRRIVARRLGATSSSNLDYGVLQLDRPATPRFAPAAVRTTRGPMTADARVTVLGFGSGIPLKIDTGGRVRDPRAATLDYFTATTDTFGGNSGSGVFDPTALEVVGILVRGETDYVRRGSCSVVNTCDERACSGESITYVSQALEALCALPGAPSARLCGSPAQCGNARCEPGETESSCAGDCAAPRCGDGRCNGDETSATCESDCGPMVPTTWTCRAAWYNAGDDCDCNCGIRDPDCDNPALPVLRCMPGQTCGASGLCEGTPRPVDAGPQPSDAANDAPSDASSVDGGLGSDATPLDATTIDSNNEGGSARPPQDGSVADAQATADATDARAPRDAPAEAASDARFEASGGCSCRVHPQQRAHGAAGPVALAALLSGLVTLRRRSATGRRPHE